MNKFEAFLILLILTICAIASSDASAQSVFNVSHNGVPAFCAPNLQVSNGVYNFIGECNTPPPPQQNQLTRANVSYPPSTAVRSADLTKWAETWGRVSITSAGSAWPLANGAAPQWTMRANQFTCTPFTTTNVTGLSQLSMMSYYTAGNVDVSIAPTCGNFDVWQSPISAYHIGGAACTKSAIGAFASAFMAYRIGDSTSSFCGLAPASTYYLNVRFHNAQPVDQSPNHTLCGALGCKVSIKSNPATR